MYMKGASDEGSERMRNIQEKTHMGLIQKSSLTEDW